MVVYVLEIVKHGVVRGDLVEHSLTECEIDCLCGAIGVALEALPRIDAGPEVGLSVPVERGTLPRLEGTSQTRTCSFSNHSVVPIARFAGVSSSSAATSGMLHVVDPPPRIEVSSPARGAWQLLISINGFAEKPSRSRDHSHPRIRREPS